MDNDKNNDITFWGTSQGSKISNCHADVFFYGLERTIQWLNMGLG
jgi:hypothetical protein